MLLKLILTVVFVPICVPKPSDVTFKDVTIRGYNMYTEKFKKNIPSTNSLKDLLPEIYVDKIEIVEQDVPVLYENSLADLLELDELVIEFSNVQEIRSGALRNVPLLRRLSFKGNKLKQIQDNVFKELEISTLDLSLNSIATIESSAFNDMPNLLNINLADNKIALWDKNWFQNTPLLSRVSMQNNSIETLPEQAFKNLEGRKKFGQVDLTVNLIFSYNKIRKIHPKAFDGLKKINNLWLDNNLLESFDQEMLGGTEVKDLRINANKIKCLEGDYKKIFKSENTHIDTNPLDCDCLEDIKLWVKDNEKTVGYFYADMECMTQRIKKKMVALEKRLKEIRGNDLEVETISIKKPEK